jgi:hypothetical protein
MCTHAQKQPHSFMPPDNTRPRVQQQPNADTDAAEEQQAALNRLQITLNLSSSVSMRGVLQLLEGLDRLNEQATPAAAAAAGPWAGFHSCNSSNGSADHTMAAALAQAAVPSTADSQGTPSLDGWLPAEQQQRSSCSTSSGGLRVPSDPDELQAALADLNSRREHPCMHRFANATPTQGVVLETAKTGLHTCVPRACHDTGCEPSLISAEYCKQAGIAVRGLTAAERADDIILNIEGEYACKIKGRTEALIIYLAKGTPYEVSFRAEKGVRVMSGAAAAQMYDFILGREFADAVSGYVVPLTQRFYYMPKLQQGDTTEHSLPMLTGHAVPRHCRYIDAAVPTSAMSFLPACSALPQEPLGTAVPNVPEQQQPQDRFAVDLRRANQTAVDPADAGQPKAAAALVMASPMLAASLGVEPQHAFQPGSSTAAACISSCSSCSSSADCVTDQVAHHPVMPGRVATLIMLAASHVAGPGSSSSSSADVLLEQACL